MIRAILLSTFTLALSALDLDQSDKRFHLAASAIGSGLIDTALQIYEPDWHPVKRMAYASGGMFLIGILKEGADAAGMGHAELDDLAADAIGCLIGAPIAELTGGMVRASISHREVTLALSWNF